jgi:hypothetical protein
LSIAALNDECTATDLDEITAKEQTITQEVTEFRERAYGSTRDPKRESKSQFESALSLRLQKLLRSWLRASPQYEMSYGVSAQLMDSRRNTIGVMLSRA